MGLKTVHNSCCWAETLDAKLFSNSSLEDIQRYTFTPDRALRDQGSDSIQTQRGELLTFLWLFMRVWGRSGFQEDEWLLGSYITDKLQLRMGDDSCKLHIGGPTLVNLPPLMYCPFPSLMPGSPAEAGLCAVGGSKWLESKVRIWWASTFFYDSGSQLPDAVIL